MVLWVQVTVWDLSVEEDDEAAMAQEEGEEPLPPQLLFVHQGQEDIKELHFHPQVCPAIKAVPCLLDPSFFWVA